MNTQAEPYEVVIATYGRRQTTRSDVFLNHHLYGEPDGPIGMDYFVWVIRNAERTIVVDTGFSEHGGRVRGREQLIGVPQLFADIGVDPASSPIVIVTHAHYDHIGNLGVFPDSPIYLGGGELEFWRGPHRHRTLFGHSVEDAELEHLEAAMAGGRITTVTGRTWVAPGVEVLEVGGHTPGQCMVRVFTTEGWVLLASDAVHYYEELERDRPFTSVADLVGMYDAFDLIRAMLASGEVDRVVPGHDPDTIERSGATPERGGTIGVIGALVGVR